MKTETKPTLASLGLVATIVRNGFGKLSSGDADMLKWNCLFTNARGQSQAFDYFTGSGCGPQLSELQLRAHFPSVANVPKHNRWSIKDKNLLAQVASFAIQQSGWTPDAIEILNCIARDGDALDATFEDWAAEFGYDQDSRKAEKIYRACQDNALRLKKILSAENIEILKGLEL